MKRMTQNRRFLVLLGLTSLFAAVCSTGCSSDKSYSGGNSTESGKAPAASAPPAAATTPDAPRVKPGSDEPGGK